MRDINIKVKESGILSIWFCACFYYNINTTLAIAVLLKLDINAGLVVCVLY